MVSMTESQLRLERNLRILFGNKEPLRQWTYPEVINELLEVRKQSNVTFLKLEGEFADRTTLDRLVTSNFQVRVNNGGTITIIW